MSLLSRVRDYLIGPPAPREVWKTEGEEFLRKEKAYMGHPGIDHFDVYALHQRSLTTNSTRIIEDWRLT